MLVLLPPEFSALVAVLAASLPPPPHAASSVLAASMVDKLFNTERSMSFPLCAHANFFVEEIAFSNVYEIHYCSIESFIAALHFDFA